MIMKKLFTVVLAVICILTLFILWASYPWQNQGFHDGQDTIQVVEDLRQPEPFSLELDTLRVLTWNIAFAYGKGSEGTGYEPHDRNMYVERLKAMAMLIRDYRVDIVLLQEIDFASARSHYINQADFLAEQADLPYFATATSWTDNYIPFPYWPISRQFGEMNSGGAVLSRYPITDHRFYLYRKPDSNPWWYNIFYLYRYTQFADIDLGERTLTLANTHFEAFDKNNRQQQARWLANYIHKEHTDLDLHGGDFNTTPLNASKKSNFEGYEEDDYQQDSTHVILGEIDHLREPIMFKDSTLLTFPALHPDRQLDYLLLSDSLRATTYKIPPAGDLSDHLPVLTEIVFTSDNSDTN